MLFLPNIAFSLDKTLQTFCSKLTTYWYFLKIDRETYRICLICLTLVSFQHNLATICWNSIKYGKIHTFWQHLVEILSNILSTFANILSLNSFAKKMRCRFRNESGTYSTPSLPENDRIDADQPLSLYTSLTGLRSYVATGQGSSPFWP